MTTPRNSRQRAQDRQTDRAGQEEVGYCKPPRKNQFKPGQSGNPNGRPKGRRNVMAMLREVYFEPIAINEDGKTRIVTMIQAIIMRMVNQAAKGDARARQSVLAMMPYLDSAEENPAASQLNATQEMQIIKNLKDRLKSKPKSVTVAPATPPQGVAPALTPAPASEVPAPLPAPVKTGFSSFFEASKKS